MFLKLADRDATPDALHSSSNINGVRRPDQLVPLHFIQGKKLPEASRHQTTPSKHSTTPCKRLKSTLWARSSCSLGLPRNGVREGVESAPTTSNQAQGVIENILSGVEWTLSAIEFYKIKAAHMHMLDLFCGTGTLDSRRQSHP